MARSVGHRLGRRGAAAVEFALTLPIFFAVLVATLDLSLFISEFHQIQRAARDGARVGSITLEGPDPDGTEIEAAAVAQAIDVLEASGRPCADGCDVTADWVLDEGGWMFVTVRVSYPYDPLTSFLPAISNAAVAEFSMLTQQQ